VVAGAHAAAEVLAAVVGGAEEARGALVVVDAGRALAALAAPLLAGADLALAGAGALAGVAFRGAVVVGLAGCLGGVGGAHHRGRAIGVDVALLGAVGRRVALHLPQADEAGAGVAGVHGAFVAHEAHVVGVGRVSAAVGAEAAFDERVLRLVTGRLGVA